MKFNHIMTDRQKALKLARGLRDMYEKRLKDSFVNHDFLVTASMAARGAQKKEFKNAIKNNSASIKVWREVFDATVYIITNLK